MIFTTAFISSNHVCMAGLGLGTVIMPRKTSGGVLSSLGGKQTMGYKYLRKLN